MRVALVHDWLTGMRGGERVLEVLAGLYPGADLHTLVHVPGATSAKIERLPIHASPISQLPGVRHYYRGLLPLLPWAATRLDLSGYDLVISCSHAFAKSVRVPERSVHVCYCLTPLRYAWDQQEAYWGRGLRRALAAPLLAWLRAFDRRSSVPDRVARFVAISHAVAGRIERHYGRSAAVVHPPVDLDFFRPDGRPADDFYLLVGGFVPYKKEGIVIEAFRQSGRSLVVAGDGPSRRRLEASAPSNVRFVGHVPDADLARLYARARALVYPQEEDFGIVAVEAQAAGRPVIAFGRGGALDTVRPLGDRTKGPPTGLYLDAQTAEAIADATLRFEAVEASFEPTAIRAWAERFSIERFRRQIEAEIGLALAQAPQTTPVASSSAA